MNNSLFFSVLNIRLLKKLIFDYIYIINTKFLEGNSVKWEEFKNFPTLLAAFGYKELLIQSIGNSTDKDVLRNVGNTLISYNNIEMYTFIINHEILQYKPNFRDYSNAIRLGRLDFLKIMYSTAPICFRNGQLFMITIKNFQVLEWVADRYDQDVYRTWNSAASNIQSSSSSTLRNSIAKSLAEKDRVQIYRIALQKACCLGRLDMVQWLMERGKIKIGQIPDDIQETALVSSTVVGGNTQIMQWLQDEKGLRFNNMDQYYYCPMDRAAEYENFEMLKYLHQHNIGSATESAMDNAAMAGHLDMIKWLHTNRTEGCTTEAMDSATRTGNLEIIKWLHENRSEGCTQYAMVGAVSSNNLEMVKWFHQNRTEGYQDNIIEVAAWTSVEMVKWIHETFGYSISPRPTTLLSALRNNRIDVIRYLHANRNREFDLLNGNENFVPDIIKDTIKIGDYDLLVLLLNGNTEWELIVQRNINQYIKHATDLKNHSAVNFLNQLKLRDNGDNSTNK